MDNPNNRSILAWKVRNVSRYYRATEDFYRRAGRMAINYPDAYWKLALTYQVLDDSGFTYRDDNGDLYFAYPGNGFLQDAFASLGSVVPGNGFGIGTAVDAFAVGGKLKSISPSTDPAQWLPSVSGPITAIGLTSLFHMAPQMQGLRALTLGEYSIAGTTPNLATEIANAILPAGVRRIWESLAPDEMNASMASSISGALAIMIANGDLDDVPQNMNLEQLKNSDIYAKAAKTAFSLQMTKMLLGFVAPASPQVFQNNITEFARDMGITGMSQLWKQLLDKHEGDYAQAYVEWERLDPDGSLLPFTISKTKNNEELTGSLAGVGPYKEVVNWTRMDGVKDLAKEYPNAYLWLAPQEGKFDWNGWALLTSLGLKVDKTEKDMVIDMLAAKSEQQDRKIRAIFDEQIAQIPDDSDVNHKAIRALEKEKAAARDYLVNENPYWRAKKTDIREGYGADRLVEMFTETNQMIQFLRERDGKLTGTAQGISSANAIWLQINSAKAGYTRQTNADKASRASLDEELAMTLTAIGKDDIGVQNYIDSLLNNLDYGSLV